MGMYGKAGFTNEAPVKALWTEHAAEWCRDREPREGRGKPDIVWFRAPASALVAAAAMLPARNLVDRQNDGPSVRQFVKVALEYPEVEFTGYVVTDERNDERVSVDGCYAPKEQALVVRSKLLRSAASAPDEEGDEGSKYRMWWD